VRSKFRDAFRGLGAALKDHSVRIQVLLGICAVIGGAIIRLSYGEWLAFILCIGAVITAEILNTAIERLCDFVEPEQNEKIGYIKDLGAGAVLAASLMSLLVCVLVVIRHFTEVL